MLDIHQYPHKKELFVNPARLKPFILCLVGLYLSGCGTQAAYMRGWDLTPSHTHRWTGGTFKVHKLSNDEKEVYTELGVPDAIRFFRALHTRQRVYEWLYQESNRAVWFVDGKRVDYVAVDTQLSRFKKETRETQREKMTAGGIVGGIVGIFAAGTLMFGKTLGLKD